MFHKKIFLYINGYLQLLRSAKDYVLVFIYTKNQKHVIRFYIQKPDTLQKARNFPLRFIYKKCDTLRYAIFMKMLKLAFIYKKHEILRHVTF